MGGDGDFAERDSRAAQNFGKAARGVARVIYLGGFSKTLVGFVVGVLGAQFIVSQSLPRLVMFVSGTLIHEVCYQAMYALVEGRAFRVHWSNTLIQAAINGIVGILAFAVVENGPALLQRRRARGVTLSRRHY